MSGFSIGERIQLWRKHRGKTLTQLAKDASMHTSSLHRIVHGTQEPRLGELEKIAAALDLSVGELAEGDLPEHLQEAATA